MSESNGFVNRRSPVQSGSPAPSGSSGDNPTPYWHSRSGCKPWSTERREREFWARVCFGHGPNACWLWTGAAPGFGHGRVRTAGRHGKTAHRFAYELVNGEAPRHLEVRHSCDNPTCVNPAHLLLGTHLDNMRDAVERNRTPYGERQHVAKLTEADVVRMREKRAAGAYGEDLASEFGVSSADVYNICAGDSWRRAGGPITPRGEQGHYKRRLVGAGSKSLTAEQIAAIRSRARFGNYVHLATEFGVSNATIYEICGPARARLPLPSPRPATAERSAP